MIAGFKTCSEIADFLNCELIGDKSREIFSLNSYINSKVGDLAFVADKKYFESIFQSESSALIISDTKYAINLDKTTYIISDKPYISFLKLVYYLNEYNKKIQNGIEKSAKIAEDVKINDTNYIGNNVVIGKGTTIGDGNIIASNTVIGDNCIIGNNNKFYPNITVYDDTIIRNNCIFHANCVIGSDGFGYEESKEGVFKKIPQIGNVIINDNVEIGANTCIDRAFVGSTIVESGVKLDNLIQIGHNCFIGENTAIVSQSGIAGSTRLGKRVRIAGQVGIAGHIEIANDVVLLAKSGVPSSITQKGVYFGIPARLKDEAFRMIFALSKLPELLKKMNKMLKDI